MNKLLTILIFTLLVQSCINLREPYPKIEYYNLSAEKTMLVDLPLRESTVMLRRVIVNESIDTPHLLVMNEPSSVQRLFYHRWISDISTISTDFILTRINQSGLLKKGVVNSSSIAIPDYIIEPQLIEMTATNYSLPDTSSNYVSVEINVKFLKRMPDNKLEIIHNGVYKQKYIRRKKGISSIPQAYSKVFSLAVDNMISDLSNIIK
ncbi:MAG: hypothetical protein WC313_06870 [Candidatus Kapaibacterium sp.]|nr:hypothetical protein [Candidatus Kapabacteria bacterium]